MSQSPQYLQKKKRKKEGGAGWKGKKLGFVVGIGIN